MSSLINKAAVEKMIVQTLEKDMHECLERVTDEVVAKLKDKVRANVAARMIALASSDYNMEYCRNELRILVKMETSR